MRVLAVAVLIALAGAAASQADAAPTTLVRFEQSGGFAGIERALVVQRTGKVVSDGLPLAKSHLTPRELTKLKTALTAARFPGLPDRFESENPIADGFVYRIAYAGHDVQIEQGAKPPLRVQRVFDLLMRLTVS
jgi:opacity protein-like surface antigen